MAFTACLDDVVRTMIRHGSFRPFLAIVFLTAEVRQAALLSTLIAAVCCTPLLAPNQLTAIYTAIALAAITTFAYKEHGTAI